jgi:predicted 2-oxoglutarate/Fe(II)-dependent dioxygenase YbiX
MAEATAAGLLVDAQFLDRVICERIVEEFHRLVAFRAGCGGCGDALRVLPNRTEMAGSIMRRSARKDVRRALSNVRAEARDAMALRYATPSLDVEFTLLTEMRPGDSHPLHADNERRTAHGKWGPNHTPWRDYAAMVYLNSVGEDFDGGVLRFPRLEREVAPRAGTLVGFSCGHEHEHEVTPIERGARYSLSIWLSADSRRAEHWRA